MVLFLTTGIGNGSTFRMIPVIFLTERTREAAGKGTAAQEQAVRDGNKEAAAVLGFSSAIGAYGGFFIPEELRHLDRDDRRPRGRALRVHRVLPDLHRGHVVVLRAQERRDAVLSVRATAGAL